MQEFLISLADEWLVGVECEESDFPIEIHKQRASRAIVSSNRGSAPNEINGDTVSIPCLTFASNPTQDIEIYKRLDPEFAHKRILTRAEASITRQTNAEAIKLINMASEAQHFTVSSTDFNATNVDTLIAYFDNKNTSCAALFTHPKLFEMICAINSDQFKDISDPTHEWQHGDVIVCGIWGSSAIFVSPNCPRQMIYALAQPNDLGVVVSDVILKLVTHEECYSNQSVPCDQPPEDKASWIGYAKRGMAILHADNVVRLKVAAENISESVNAC